MACRFSVLQACIPHEHCLTDRMASECGTLAGLMSLVSGHLQEGGWGKLPLLLLAALGSAHLTWNR